MIWIWCSLSIVDHPGPPFFDRSHRPGLKAIIQYLNYQIMTEYATTKKGSQVRIICLLLAEAGRSELLSS